MRRLAALLGVLVASACAGGDDSATDTVTVTTATTVTVTTPTTVTVTQTETNAQATSATLPVDAFNARAESVDEPWERDLRATVDEFIGRDQVDAPSVSFQATSGPEGGDPTSASLLLDGLLDDSVRSRRYDLTLSRRDDGTWRVDSASWAQRCQEGRGHQAFTPVPCK